MDERLNRHDLTDEEWRRVLPMMPADARRGRRWSDHRMVINEIMFRTRTGCPWRDLPGEYGNWKTAYNRHRRWSLDGMWEKILDRLRAGCDEAEGPDWTVSADSTVVRALQPASSAANRAYPRRRGIQAVIPVKEDQQKHRRNRGSAGGRPPAFDAARYKERNTVERCFSVDVASIRIWLRDPV